MTRPPIYNGFLHLTPNHHSHGYWRTPEGQVQYGYKDLQPYIDVVKTLERGKLDALFIADVVGVYDLEYGDGTATIRAGSQFPGNDPASIVSALGYVTEHLGIAITSNIIQDHPFSFARRLSTLDHYTHGRIAWNIVTSYLSNGFRNFGYDTIAPHADRYVWAQEYLDVTYKLWEHSWDDEAVVHDPGTGVLFDPERIRTIDHVGERYRVQGPHLVEPSPQRSPVLFQAGNSTAGRAFAARNAEVTFLPSFTPDAARNDIAALNQQVVEFGREPGAVKTIVQLSTVIGSTEEEALRKQQYLRDNIDFDGLVGFYSGGSGVDFTSVDPETPLSELKDRIALGDHVRSIFRAIVDADLGEGRDLTWREYLIDHALLPGKFAGTPEQIADHVREWVDAGVDGFNVVPITTLGWWDEWVDHVVPVLRSRGLAQEEYAPGTLRQKLFGAGDRLPESHYGRQPSLRPAAGV
ncbi:NtaA/DmoA family FMN-dependent monooxygenase [Leucobacter weissii]|uniref:NtaA/DmoA family FMN-dependent monooxygenase n=1 Tax=Leucobacter weissii TaxID=1983706 RepID=A0A939SBL5_9MICO|nr:NtaA/DmoA family FMN-dependent monooxygenase [Leucobacter weissii]MBO1903102.1 NtaA/DmoA family FMN-dependent monooxygenase [Leucobacter weissii]